MVLELMQIVSVEDALCISNKITKQFYKSRFENFKAGFFFE
jgi:hypothetical protein